MSFIRSISLHHFRSYEFARLDNVQAGMLVLTGPNGAGKTNVLEAVSLLSPGRGLRNAAIEDVQKRDVLTPWVIAADINTGGATASLGIGGDLSGGKRIVKINGVAMKSQLSLSDYCSCVWLTPQMDRIFLDSAGGRRRFYDKLAFAFDPTHAGRITRYENAMAQRSKLLREGKTEPSWILSLERQMAETGIAIAAARLDFLTKLQHACDSAGTDESMFFPKARLSLSGTVEDLLTRAPALEVEDMIVYQLRESRVRDAETGGAATGPHKTDLLTRYAEKDMPADQCSTGEQKALLIGMILAHARLLRAEKGMPPILLLDEIAAHLDEKRRAALFCLLHAIGAQVWMTGTDRSVFSAASCQAQFWTIEHGRASLSSA